MDQSLNNVPNLLKELNEIGVALSAEKDHNHLLELILVKAMDITNSDGGTLYICTNKKSLKFEILHNRSLAIHKGGTSGEDILLPPIPLYDEQGNKNNKMIAAYAVNSSQTVSIKDAYINKDFDFINNNKHKKIGISWQTNSINNRKGRNIPLIFFKKILKINKCKFIDLQYGDTSLEREKIKTALGVNIFHIENLDYKNDIENLSKLISKCDLVITIPNFTTQLAAAIGVPVYLLLPYSSDWRWFLKRTDTLWYNNIKLFRQKKLGNWNDVIDEVYNSLKINKWNTQKMSY